MAGLTSVAYNISQPYLPSLCASDSGCMSTLQCNKSWTLLFSFCLLAVDVIVSNDEKCLIV